MTSSKLILNVLASIQGSLLGNITPNLRAVEVVMEDDKFFNINFYYDNEASEDEVELSSLAETEFISDFPGPIYETNLNIKTLPYPNKIPQNGFLVYKRYEK